MSHLLDGWKKVEECVIPSVPEDACGVDVVRREYIEPYRSTGSVQNLEVVEQSVSVEEQKVEFSEGEDPTLMRPVMIEKDDDDKTLILDRSVVIVGKLVNERTREIITIDKSPFVIGRSSMSDYTIADNPFVGKKHAQIVREGDTFYVEDCDSLNGVYVNGCKIASSTLLNDKDAIDLSEEILTFEVEKYNA